MKYLFLRHVPLHLLGEGHHPTENVFSVLSVRVVSPGQPHALHRAALCFTAPVAAEYPAVFLFASVKSHLFFMFLPPCIVTGEIVAFRSGLLLPQYFFKSQDYFFFNRFDKNHLRSTK